MSLMIQEINKIFLTSEHIINFSKMCNNVFEVKIYVHVCTHSQYKVWVIKYFFVFPLDGACIYVQSDTLDFPLFT